MDGENNGKPYSNGMIWGYHYFRNVKKYIYIYIYIYINDSMQLHLNFCVDQIWFCLRIQYT